MAARAKLTGEATVESDEGHVVQRVPFEARWQPVTKNGEREIYSIAASTFQALTVPSGANAVMILFETTSDTLTLKGITGDTGIAISPASAVIPVPVILPLGASPSIGILNGGTSTETIEVIWL